MLMGSAQHFYCGHLWLTLQEPQTLTTPSWFQGDFLIKSGQWHGKYVDSKHLQIHQAPGKSALLSAWSCFSNLSFDSFDCLEYFSSHLPSPSLRLASLSCPPHSHLAPLSSSFFPLRLPYKSRLWKKMRLTTRPTRMFIGCHPHEFICRRAARSLWFLSERRDFLSTFKHHMMLMSATRLCHYPSVRILWTLGHAQIPGFCNISIEWEFHG